MDASTDDDEIIAEMPVYVMPSGDAKLYNVQMPLLASGNKLVADHVDDSAVAVRFKRKQEVLEVSVPMDDSKAGLCAANSAPQRRTFVGRASKSRPDAVGRYAVGVFRHGALYLSPLAGTIELRPSFAPAADAKNDTAGAQPEPDASTDSDTEAQQSSSSGAFRVKFSRETANPSLRRRKAELEAKQLLHDTDPWMHMQYCGQASSQSSDERAALASTSRAADAAGERLFDLRAVTTKDILRAVCPQPADDVCKTPSAGGLSLRAVGELKLEQQITNLCLKAHVLGYEELLEFLHDDVDAACVVAALEKVATKVGHLWVAKSERVLPKDQCSPRTGISYELLGLARDFILHKFRNGETFTRRELTELVHIPDEDLAFVLDKVGTFDKAQRCWRLKDHSIVDDGVCVSSASVEPSDGSRQYWTQRGAEVQTWLARATAERDAQGNRAGAHDTAADGAGGGETQAHKAAAAGANHTLPGRRRRRSSTLGSPPRRQRHSSTASHRASNAGGGASVQPGQTIQLTVAGTQ